MSSLRYRIRHSQHPAAQTIRHLRRAVLDFHLPVWRPLVRPIAHAFELARTVLLWIYRVFVCEPYFKAKCESVGHNVSTGHALHFISGSGKIFLGDDVHIDGKSGIFFASVLEAPPELHVGDASYINGACAIVVARRVTIGRQVMIGAQVSILDSPGHPLDAELRIAGAPPLPDQIRPVTIHDKAWIGTGARIMPGVTIGEGAVIAAGAIVTRDVPPYVLAAGIPATVVKALSAGCPTSGGTSA